ncbi:histidine triad nucleotide-binding protein [Bifidobacterium crudilactis]|uniref:histidine triad nucleotide-binding protein n=1 Tax=Bifidobacterium crudilactis TaxID=327277 RepID=UPI0026471A78|nr:histidine triad nucleotide-binding protein [Bifidobacterium crudilactis]MDN5973036.1 histidine triad nucleotide-binding protein [Bifidobacterium crudilactis]MDN6001833.1 histidine triad nucleotide-binding protein [Bifidobacterium crudilactis]MDN6209918.1 histidine triad nucleotide-binding protein [Bifidobacterium crudilactis]MDN6234344.1 histidine triad nucleotide-binding protein [Bifidobacterium crudilactis]MDN6459041.1 histidine triad nucleotide-binding protein [Bifidobacterium crudilacti
MSDSEGCLFCSIVKGEVPSTKVYEDEQVFAFEDIAPKAKVHVLIVPKQHVASVAELADSDSRTLTHIVDVARDIATERYNGSFRLVFNTGADAGQTVFHAHAHVLTGEVLDE